MRWHNFKLWEKALIAILLLWCTAGWLVAGLFPNPRLFIEAPYLLVFGTIILLTAASWVLRKLGH